MAINFYQVIASFFFVLHHLLLHLKGFICQLISLAIRYITFLLHLKDFCYSAILLATLQCNYRNKAMRFGINCTPTIETNVSQLNHYVISTSNSMGSSEIWDKYHSCCIGNGKFPIQHSWYLSQISPREIYLHFQYNKSGIYPKFHCYPCYSQLIPYSLHIRMLYIHLRNLSLCTKHVSTLIGTTLST